MGESLGALGVRMSLQDALSGGVGRGVGGQSTLTRLPRCGNVGESLFKIMCNREQQFRTVQILS